MKSLVFSDFPLKLDTYSNVNAFDVFTRYRTMEGFLIDINRFHCEKASSEGKQNSQAFTALLKVTDSFL